MNNQSPTRGSRKQPVLQCIVRVGFGMIISGNHHHRLSFLCSPNQDSFVRFFTLMRLDHSTKSLHNRFLILAHMLQVLSLNSLKIALVRHYAVLLKQIGRKCYVYVEKINTGMYDCYNQYCYLRICETFNDSDASLRSFYRGNE